MFAKLKYDAKSQPLTLALMITCTIFTCPMNRGIHRTKSSMLLLRMKMFSNKPILHAPADR